MSSHRRKPFSAKQKKVQLQNKRQEKSARKNDDKNDPVKSALAAINKNATSSNTERFALQFERDEKEDIERRKLESQKPFVSVREEDKEVEISDIYSEKLVDYGIPIRPDWSYKMTKKDLYTNEEEYYAKYLKELKSITFDDGKALAYFDQNLETWRQLWRVLEKSDVLIIICDVRFPAFHFPPALYNAISLVYKKPVLVVLNKIDCAPLENYIAWKKYFEGRYSNLLVVPFTSYPLFMKNTEKVSEKKKKQMMRYKSFGTDLIYDSVVKLLQSEKKQERFSKWGEKVRSDKGEYAEELVVEGKNNDDDDKEMWHRVENNKHDYIVLGCVGYPNVGKSSVINSLMGKKVVSVSKTPGHTKYFQTIFLTEDVCLCDCPGLVFPSNASKQLQIIAGVYPISQVQEPYSVIGYIASRTDLVKALSLKHPALIEDEEGIEQDENERQWSAWDICTCMLFYKKKLAWAFKSGFLTAKAGRPDVYRAANNLLRMTAAGRVGVYSLPVKFASFKEQIVHSEEYRELKKKLDSLFL